MLARALPGRKCFNTARLLLSINPPRSPPFAWPGLCPWSQQELRRYKEQEGKETRLGPRQRASPQVMAQAFRPELQTSELLLSWENSRLTFNLKVFYPDYENYIWDTATSGFPGASHGKESACNAGDQVWSLGGEDPLEKGVATHSSILAWRIPWTEESGALQSMWSLRVRHVE